MKIFSLMLQNKRNIDLRKKKEWGNKIKILIIIIIAIEQYLIIC